jgi:hypothetical protein
MRSSVALLVLPLLASSVLAQMDRPRELEKIVPEDALIHVVVDGVDPVKNSLSELMNAVMPGMGGMMVEAQLQQVLAQPGIDQIDTSKPIALTILPEDQALLAVPVKDTSSFETTMREVVGEDLASVISGEGCCLLVMQKAATLEQLRSAPPARGPSLQGPIRGFLNVKKLHAKFLPQIEGMMMMAAMAAGPGAGDIGESLNRFVRDVPRIDFALVPSKSGFELALAFTTTPDAKGFLGAIARAPAASATNPLTTIIPQDSVIAASGRWSAELGSAFAAYIERLPLLSGIKAEDRAKVLDLLQKQFNLIVGEFAFAASPAPAEGGLGTVAAMACRDPEKFRASLKESCESVAAAQAMMSTVVPGATVKWTFKPAVKTIAGIEVDEVSTHWSVPETPPASQANFMGWIRTLYSEPARVAYPSGYAVTVAGPGGEARLEQTLTSLKSGTTTAAAAKALPSGTTFSLAMNLMGLVKMLAPMMPAELAGPMGMLAKAPAGSDFITLTAAPRNGAAEIHLKIPASLFQSIMALQGAGGR